MKTAARFTVDPKLIIFETFMGRSYSDNPRAIYEYMLSDPRFDDYSFIWVFRGRKIDETDITQHPNLKRASFVRYKSPEYHEAYAKAGIWISNSRIPGYMPIKPEQHYIQTWHGTPLKRLGYDVDSSDSRAKRSPEDIRGRNDRDAVRYTSMISAGPYVTKAFRSSFNLDAVNPNCQIWEIGYPRNDRLCTENLSAAAKLKEEFDLPRDKRIILYAPTWRDDQHEVNLGYTYENKMDFNQLQRYFGDTHIILFRPHYFVANEFDFAAYEGFVHDVGGVQDINDLYLVSDMLITDYSSVFFDYAILKRPIVFYMYDLAQYAENLRGFYLSLDELPGPITEDMDGLIRFINEPPVVGPEFDEFIRKFAPLHDGKASQHAAEKILALT